ncbi:hypothetical protein, partial [Tabrizicola sp.]|uniref:primosomal protein N' family DNA-binding protein n=1 Tax=Tabrizicola sp. TaxID=2005166 RepID=UPI00352333DA
MTKTAPKDPDSHDIEDLWEVAVALPIFHTLTYRLPAALAEDARVGSLVKVPVVRRQAAG